MSCFSCICCESVPRINNNTTPISANDITIKSTLQSASYYQLQHPRVIGLTNGSFFVVWAAEETVGANDFNIWGMIVSDSGSKGSEFQINSSCITFLYTCIRGASIIFDHTRKIAEYGLYSH